MFQAHIPSLQFLELSDLVYSSCNYIVTKEEILEFPPSSSQCRVLLRAQFRSLSPPECAARVRGISKLRGSFRGPVRPKVRNSEVRASVRDRTRSISFRHSPAIPGTAARVRALSEADPRPIGSSQTVLQSLVPSRTPARHSATLHTP